MTDDRTPVMAWRPERLRLRPVRLVAAWLVSEALGWARVPETVLRDGPYGEGSVQRFVDADFEEHYFTLLEDD